MKFALFLCVCLVAQQQERKVRCRHCASKGVYCKEDCFPTDNQMVVNIYYYDSLMILVGT
jgi:hypothetical protein